MTLKNIFKKKKIHNILFLFLQQPSIKYVYISISSIITIFYLNKHITNFTLASINRTMAIDFFNFNLNSINSFNVYIRIQFF